MIKHEDVKTYILHIYIYVCLYVCVYILLNMYTYIYIYICIELINDGWWCCLMISWGLYCSNTPNLREIITVHELGDPINRRVWRDFNQCSIGLARTYAISLALIAHKHWAFTQKMCWHTIETMAIVWTVLLSTRFSHRPQCPKHLFGKHQRQDCAST